MAKRRRERVTMRGGELLTRREAAEYLGIGYYSIIYHSNRGAIPMVRVPRGQYVWHYYRRTDLDVFKKEGTFKRERAANEEMLLAASHSAKTANEKIDALLRVLGMDHGHLPTDRGAIMFAYNWVTAYVAGKSGLTADEALTWAQNMSIVTEAYFRLVWLHTGDIKPWEKFEEFFRKLAGEYAIGSLLRAQLCNALIACRQAGYLAANGRRIQDQKVTNQLDEVREILFTPVRSARYRSQKSGYQGLLDAE